jgi:tRNA uridine 5-carbamoylmethylation protein Kti12
LTKETIIKGNNVIIDSTLFNGESARKTLLCSFIDISEEIRKIAVIISADIETCIQRDSCRNDTRRVGRNVIMSLSDKFTMPSSSEGWDFVHVVSEQCDIEKLINMTKNANMINADC